MKKLLNGIIKNYRKINITILSICVYFLTFPLIARVIEKISPSVTECTYLKLTGKPCPLCGGTRFIRNIGNVFFDISYILNFFGVIVMILITEIIFRIINILKKKYNEKTIKTDIVIHAILFILYNIYLIWFITKE